MESGMGMAGLQRLVTGRTRRLTQEAYAKARPTRNAFVEEEPFEGGVRLKAPLQSQGSGMLGALAKWAKLPDTKEFELETVGAFVWSLCDGQHSTEGIARKLRERFKMNRLEADTALGAFLETLSRRKLIVLAVPMKK